MNVCTLILYHNKHNSNLLAFAGRIHKMINFALNINADDAMDAEEDEAPELEESGEDTSTKMEEQQYIHVLLAFFTSLMKDSKEDEVNQS